MIDIFFKESNAHLEDIVEQLEKGRTSTKTRIEIGLLNQAKIECLKEKESQLQSLDLEAS